MNKNDKELLDFFLNVEPDKITLTDQQYQRLAKILEAESEPNEKLRELLAKKAPWELGKE